MFIFLFVFANPSTNVVKYSCGAFLSLMDTLTDMYTIATYYQSDKLVGQANALLAMVVANLLISLLTVFATNKKSWTSMRKEMLITLFFLRPAVDAYRVCSNTDISNIVDPLDLMMFNKCIELATEAIPGCVLQIYVFLTNPEETGAYALVSIGISAMCTGFASAMIAFDKDIDVAGRREQPQFYGMIPDDSSARGVCFALMSMINALHNLSRSVGTALLAASPKGGTLVALFVGGEMVLFLLSKILRGDFICWVRVDGVLSAIISLPTESK